MIAAESYVHYDFRNYLDSNEAIDPEAKGDFEKYKTRILLRYMAGYSTKKNDSIISGTLKEADKYYGLMTGKAYTELYKRIYENKVSLMANAGANGDKGFISSLPAMIQKINNIDGVVEEVSAFVQDLDKKMESMWKLASKPGTWNSFQKNAIDAFMTEQGLNSPTDNKFIKTVFENIKKKSGDGFICIEGDPNELDSTFTNIALLSASIRKPPDGDYASAVSDLTSRESGKIFKQISDKIAGYVSYLQGEGGEIANAVAGIKMRDFLHDNIDEVEKMVVQTAKVGSKKINALSGVFLSSVTFKPDESFLKEFQESKPVKGVKKVQGKSDVMVKITDDKVSFIFGINVKNYTLLPEMTHRKINFGEMSFSEALSNIKDFIDNGRFTGYVMNVAMGRISSRFDGDLWVQRRHGKTSSMSDLTRRWNNIVNLFGYSVLDKAISGDYKTKKTESLFVSINGNIYPLNEIYSFVLKGEVVPVLKTSVKRVDFMRANGWMGKRMPNPSDAQARQPDTIAAFNSKMDSAKLRIALIFPRARIE